MSKYILMPVIPTQEMLQVITRSQWPEDWEKGKEFQRENGLDIVPPVSEFECAFGQYQRLLELGKKE
jgi:hypothetical protein